MSVSDAYTLKALPRQSRGKWLFDQDLARARAAMERAWLETTPVQEVGTE